MSKKTIFLITIIIGLLLTALVTKNGDIVLIASFFIIYLLAGIICSPVKEEIKLSANRSLNRTKNGDVTIVEMSVRIKNEGENTLCVFLSDPGQPGMDIIDGSLCLQTALDPGQETELKYSFETIYGGFDWYHINTKVCDPFDCIISDVDIKAEAEIFVHPLVKKLKPLNIHAWKTLSSPGNIQTRAAGSGTDFRGVRDYHQGDPLKSIYWRLTARHPGKFFSREYIQENNTEIALILDGRYKMDLSYGNESLFEVGLKTAASLARMFLHQGYRVGLTVSGRCNSMVMPNYGKKQLNRILNCLALSKEMQEDSHDVLHSIPFKHYSSKALFIIISPLDSNDIEFYRRLRSMGFQTVLICPDTLDIISKDLAQDKLTADSFRALQMQRTLDLRLISHMSVSVINWKVEKPLYPLLKNALGKNVLRVTKI
jgi:uncharacterized protein (DUF58 family)